MAWRPNDYVISGELDNTVPQKITGFIIFAGIGKVTYNLKGNFHRDIRGAKLRFTGHGEQANPEEAKRYLQGFSKRQTGNAGDITAGRQPADYVDYPYYAESNIMLSVPLFRAWGCSRHSFTPHNLQ